MGDFGNRCNVRDKKTGITGRFDPYQFGLPINHIIPGVRISGVLHESEFNMAALRENGSGLFITLSKDIQGCHHIVTRPRDGEDEIK